jgi:type IV secretion system protein VirB2
MARNGFPIARCWPLILAALLMALFPQASFAGQQGGGGQAMPWEGPITAVLNSLTGPVAQALCILAVVGLGFGMAFSEGGSVMRRTMGLLFGCSIAVTAVTFATTFFGFAAGGAM